MNAYAMDNAPKPEETPNEFPWAIQYRDHSQYELNDRFCSDILTHLFLDKYLYWVEHEAWMRWTGYKWELDVSNSLFSKTIRRLPKAIRHIADTYIIPYATTKEGKKICNEWLRFVRKVGNKSAVQAAIDVLKTDVRMQCRTEELNSDPRWLGCKNGIVDLETGVLTSFMDENPLLITQSTNIDYIPDADMTDWETTVLKICCGDEQLAEWLQMAIGYSITGCATEQCFFLVHGRGSNGKSTLFDLLRKALGDYSIFGNCDMIEEENVRQSDRPRPDLLRLFGKRVMLIDETKPITILNEGLLKRMSGGTPIVARAMRANEYVEFEMDAKIWVAFNREPRIKGADDGMWRRIRRVPFHAKFSAEDPDFDPHIKERLAANLGSILRWAVKGAQKWYFHGRLGWCDAVLESTSQYKADQDVLADFLELAVEEEEDQWVYCKTLYQRYVEYCDDYKVHRNARLGEKTFNDLLLERGFEKGGKRGAKRMVAWKGVKDVYFPPSKIDMVY